MDKKILSLENKIKNMKGFSKAELMNLFDFLLIDLKDEYQIDPAINILYASDYFRYLVRDKFSLKKFKRRIKPLAYYDVNLNLYREKGISFNGLSYKYRMFSDKVFRLNANYIYIYALFHEFWHAYQISRIKKTIRKGEFDVYAYQVLNSFLTSSIDLEFYENNHRFFECEIDAYINANKIILDNFDKPILRLFESNKDLFENDIVINEQRRLTPQYIDVENHLKNFNLDKQKSALLNTFSLFDHCYLKDYSIIQLIESKEAFLETIADHMLNKDDYHNGVGQLRATCDFFDYIIGRRILLCSDHEIDSILKNARLDTVIKLKTVLEKVQEQKFDYPKSISYQKKRAVHK